MNYKKTVVFIFSFFIIKSVGFSTYKVCIEIERFYDIKDLYYCLIYHNIKYPKIVYAQAILETGNFTSKVYLKNNNLFGLCNNQGYYKFENYEESILKYIQYIQYRYKDNEDYYSFLKRIKYASDKNYIKKLKQIVQRI